MQSNLIFFLFVQIKRNYVIRLSCVFMKKCENRYLIDKSFINTSLRRKSLVFKWYWRFLLDWQNEKIRPSDYDLVSTLVVVNFNAVASIDTENPSNFRCLRLKWRNIMIPLNFVCGTLISLRHNSLDTPPLISLIFKRWRVTQSHLQPFNRIESHAKDRVCMVQHSTSFKIWQWKKKPAWIAFELLLKWRMFGNFEIATKNSDCAIWCDISHKTAARA